jgi:hypothetical protein
MSFYHTTPYLILPKGIKRKIAIYVEYIGIKEVLCMEKTELGLNKLLSETLLARLETKALLELLIEKGLMTQEGYDRKFNQVRNELTEAHLAKELGINVDSFKELVTK